MIIKILEEAQYLRGTKSNASNYFSEKVIARRMKFK
jgi:hypothetical protein